MLLGQLSAFYGRPVRSGTKDRFIYVCICIYLFSSYVNILIYEEIFISHQRGMQTKPAVNMWREKMGFKWVSLNIQVYFLISQGEAEGWREPVTGAKGGPGSLCWDHKSTHHVGACTSHVCTDRWFLLLLYLLIEFLHMETWICHRFPEVPSFVTVYSFMHPTPLSEL